MSVHASGLAPVVLLVVLSLIMASITDAAYDQAFIDRVRVIRDDLDRVSAGGGELKVSLDQLKQVFEEYQSLPENLKTRLRSVDQVRLVIDFALAPMQLKEPPKLMVVKENYKRFRSNYMSGDSINTGGYKKAMKRIENLYRKIVEDSKELELDDFVAAKSEALGHLKRMNELAENGLVHQKISEFEDLIKLFNRGRFKALYAYVFPAMKHSNDVEELKKLFLDNTFLFGHKYIDGKENFLYVIKNTAGFLHVF